MYEQTRDYDGSGNGCLNFQQFWRCARSDYSAGRLNSKEWNQRFLCADGDADDCLDKTEFENMLAVGFGEPGEATIDAIAFSTLDTLTANGYTELE